MNSRNLSFIQRFNKRCYYPRADNKILTKSLAKQYGISVPELISTIKYTGEIKNITEITDSLTDFVIKPARGAGGEGIIVITGKSTEGFLRGRGDVVTLNEIRLHCANILHGLHSLGGKPDQILLEERIKFLPLFEGIAVSGVPDVRLIVYKGVPLMAMLRLPTYASRGRANLHQGAIGVGIDISTGITKSGVHGTSYIDLHPDTGRSINGLQLPEWKRLIDIASRCYEFSGLGYLGVDIVFDEEKGPLLLEVNARPGLAIQIANRIGLRERIAEVDTILEHKEELGHEDRVGISLSLTAGKAISSTVQ